MNPIKRHKIIQPLSREHHNGLLLCWKIRKGIIKSIDPDRIKKYSDWFYQKHLLPHFEIEEKYLFPILGDYNELVKRALAEHRKLKRLFENQDEKIKSLSLIEEDLENHIRFEERILFNKIQEIATENELALIASVHKDTQLTDNWDDPFWEGLN